MGHSPSYVFGSEVTHCSACWSFSGMFREHVGILTLGSMLAFILHKIKNILSEKVSGI